MTSENHLAKRIFHSRTFLVAAVGAGTALAAWDIVSQFLR